MRVKRAISFVVVALTAVTLIGWGYSYAKVHKIARNLIPTPVIHERGLIPGMVSTETLGPQDATLGMAQSIFTSPDTCVVYHFSVTETIWVTPDFLTGNGEYLYAFQDPASMECPGNILPFQVEEIWFGPLFIPAPCVIAVQGLVIQADMSNPSCPQPGDVISQTTVHSDTLEQPGWYSLYYPMEEQVCVYGPYFSAIIVHSSVDEGVAVTSDYDGCTYCLNYCSRPEMLVDLCEYLPGDIRLWSWGETYDQNSCAECTVRVEDAEGAPGDTDVHVYVSLDCNVPTTMLNCVISEIPDPNNHLRPTGMSPTGRATTITAIAFGEHAYNETHMMIGTFPYEPIPAGTGPVMEVTYEIDSQAQPGSYVTSLSEVEVTGTSGQYIPVVTENGELTVFVENEPPVAILLVDPQSGDAPLEVLFDGSGSYDVDGTIVFRLLDFGDGEYDSTSGPIVSHTYFEPGNYTATLTVVDNEGLTDDDSEIIIVGIPPRPVTINEELECSITDSVVCFPSVKFDSLSGCSGFDYKEHPPWLVVCKDETNQAKAVIVPANQAGNVTFRSQDEKYVTVAPATATSSPQTVTVRGVEETWPTLEPAIEAKVGDAVCATMRTCVKTEKIVTVAAHIIRDNATPPHASTRNVADVQGWIDEMNTIWKQACVRFDLKQTNNVTVTADLGAVVNWRDNEWNTVVGAVGNGVADLHIYFVWEYEQRKPENQDRTDAACLTGQIFFEDNAGTQIGETLAHEAGHHLGVDPSDYTDAGKKDELMYAYTDQRGCMITKKQADQANPFIF